MNKTKIPWVKNPDGSQGRTWNPISGCLNHINGMCKGGNFPCYAYKLANGRLRSRYRANDNYALLPGLTRDLVAETDPFYPRFWQDRLYHPWGGKPKGVFVCDMSDLFGIGIPWEWTAKILDLCKLHNENRYYLLTKQPQNLEKFSPFPNHCWVGVTATDWLRFSDALGHLATIEAKVKYLSLEPLLGEIKLDMLQTMMFPGVIDWVIIGACTGTRKDMEELIKRYPELTLMPFGNKWSAQPKIEWVEEIVRACDKAGLEVFLKENLRALLEGHPEPFQTKVFQSDTTAYYLLRQEMPTTNV